MVHQNLDTIVGNTDSGTHHHTRKKSSFINYYSVGYNGDKESYNQSKAASDSILKFI